MVSCAVPGCTSTRTNNPQNYSFHQFPVNPDTHEKWLRMINRDNWTPNKYSTVCSKHFRANCFTAVTRKRRKMRNGSIPTINMPIRKNRILKKRNMRSGSISTPNYQYDKMSEALIKMQIPYVESSSVECRACLQIMSTDAVLYNIMDCWQPPWEGMEESIAKDLSKLTNIQISETDKHSKILCEMCCHMLLAACNFVCVVKRSDEILRQRNDLTESNEKIWPQPIQVDKSLSNDFNCSIDLNIKQEVDSDEEGNSVNGSYNEFMPNLDIVKIEPEEMIQQQPIKIELTDSHEDNLPTDNVNDHNTHLTNGNNDGGDNYSDANIKEEPLSEEDETEAIVQDMPLECLLCTKSFNSVTGLKAHVIAQHSYKSVKRKTSTCDSPEKKSRKYICAICRRTFTTSTDLMVHETCHNKSVCYGCNESFDTFEQLTKHRRTCKAISSKVTKVKTLDDVLRPQPLEMQELKCTLCDEVFSDPYYMSIHIEIHHNSEQNDTDIPMQVAALDV